MKNKTLMATAFAGLLALFGGSSSAAVVTISGTNFDLQYDTVNLGLFGAPSFSADGLNVLFTPINFKASSIGTQGTVQVDSTVIFDLIPKNGTQLVGLDLRELGDYKLVDRGSQSTPTVSVSGQLYLNNLSNFQLYNVVNFNSTQPLTTTCSTPSCATTSWDVQSTVSADQDWGSVAIRVILENILVAESFELGDSAFIQKKIVLTPAIVPVPTSILLFGSGLMGMIGLRRKNKA